jgi:hypothetical protein
MYSQLWSAAASARHAELEIDTATESDGQHVRDAPRADTDSADRRRLVLATLAALALVSAAVVVTNSIETTTTNTLDAVVSTQSSTVSHRTGCSNWREARLSRYTDVNISFCEQKCGSSAGCAYYNYQPGACGINSEGEPNGIKAESCYLFTQQCKPESNPCWDLYQNAAPKPGWTMIGPRHGCSNWKSLRIGDVLLDKTLPTCGSLCFNDPNCATFNFQPGPCSGDEMVGQGACYLFRDGCLEHNNTCWDLYEVVRGVQVATTAEATPKGSTTINVASTAGFQVGDAIAVQYYDGTSQTFLVTQIGSLIVKEKTVKRLYGGEAVWVQPSTITTPTATTTA